MGRPKGWASDRTGRPAMRSPGRPPVGRREHRQRFWAAIARGATSIEAAAEAGVSGVVGVRWFREGGGMPTVTQAPPSGRYLSFAEREEIALLHATGCGVREIARRLGRSPSTISRELRRKCGHAWRPSGLSSLDGAVACRPARPTSQAGEAGGQRRAAPVCAGPSLRGGQAAGRELGGGSGGPLGWSSSWPSQGPAMGQGVES